MYQCPAWKANGYIGYARAHRWRECTGGGQLKGQLDHWKACPSMGNKSEILQRWSCPNGWQAAQQGRVSVPVLVPPTLQQVLTAFITLGKGLLTLIQLSQICGDCLLFRSPRYPFCFLGEGFGLELPTL